MKLRIGRREVNISNPDKVFFPKRGLKKIDLVKLPRRVGLRAQPRATPPDADVALSRRRGGVVLLPVERTS
jgi:DNA primase